MSKLQFNQYQLIHLPETSSKLHSNFTLLSNCIRIRLLPEMPFHRYVIRKLAVIAFLSVEELGKSHRKQAYFSCLDYTDVIRSLRSIRFPAQVVRISRDFDQN